MDFHLAAFHVFCYTVQKEAEGVRTMSTLWERSEQGVSVGYEEKVVRIRTDQALMDYLGLPGNGSLPLAEQILARYQELFGKPLAISAPSLAVELLIHAYIDEFARKQEALSAHLPGSLGEPLAKLGRSLHRHTEIIDSGEESVDTNRWVFDRLAPYCGLICRILGDRA